MFVLLGYSGHTFDFVVIPPQVLFDVFQEFMDHSRSCITYLWATARNRCFETRGLFDDTCGDGIHVEEVIGFAVAGF